MVPRKTISYVEKTYSKEAVFASLNTPPNERSSWQIDSLTMLFINSPEFLKIAKNKREIRVIAQNVELEFHNPNSVLFSVNDPFDGIYFIYKGQVALLQEKEEIESSSPNFIKLPSGVNNSVRQNQLKCDLRHSRSDQNIKNDLYYDENDKKNISSTTSSEENDTYSNIRLSTFQRTDIQAPSYSIPLMTTYLLECKFGFGKKFEVIEIKKSNSIIGANSSEVMKQRPWSCTAIVTEPTYIIRIESSLYRKAIGYLRTEEQLYIARFLEGIHEFYPISDRPEILERLSKDMKTISIPKGAKRIPNQLNSFNLENCWFVIKSGSVGRYRKTDFDQISIDQRALFVGCKKIKIPKGIRLIKTETYGPKHCLADPSLSKELKKPYELKFLEDSVVHIISYEDIKAIIPFTLRKQIEKTLLDDPSDDELIRCWCEKEFAIQWHMYRHQVSKEAKLFALNEKIKMTGEVPCRRPSPPKKIKDHQLALKNPRFRACREIEKSKEQKTIDWAPSFRHLMENKL